MAEAKASSAMEWLKWLSVAVLLGAAVAVNVVFAEESLLYRVLGIVAIAVVAGLVALQTAKGGDFSVLVKEARIEIRKVVWPTRQETLQTTGLVLLVVLITALILWALDSGLGWLASLVIG